MNTLKLCFLTLVLSLTSFAAGDKSCTYNEWSGSLVLRYAAHDPQQARGWAPTELVLCKDKDGLYAIVTHAAIGLGQLADLPYRIPKRIEEMQADKEYAWLVNESSSYDERDALKFFDEKPIQAVILFTGSKQQILVFRKELSQVVSNTLFLAEEGATH